MSNKYHFYKTKYARYSPSDVFVLLPECQREYGDDKLIGIYTPIGQHSEASLNYVISNCVEISKAKYLKVSGEFYTPEDYLLSY